jgi:hypothetical protein
VTIAAHCAAIMMANASVGSIAIILVLQSLVGRIPSEEYSRPALTIGPAGRGFRGRNAKRCGKQLHSTG